MIDKKVKSIVLLSGGKDSVATSIWCLKNGWNPEFDFCDTGWEHPMLYQYLNYLEGALGIKINFLKSNKYENFIDMVIKKGRFPSKMARFCTEELKVKPQINHILDSGINNFIVFQGIRKAESKKRSQMNKHCTFFKYYFEPYGYDVKTGKPKYHSYRKDEVITNYSPEHNGYVNDVIRPVFDLTAEEVFEMHKKEGIDPNPLYKLNVGRVGCFPCININFDELWSIYLRQPKFLWDLAEWEEKLDTTFFSPDHIPKRYHTKFINVWKKVSEYNQEELEYLNQYMDCEIKGDKIHIKMSVCTIKDVIRYLEDKHAQGHIFDEHNPYKVTSCDSIYNICE